jgi:TRAP transporter 4TM/12TM fusion protein
LLLQVDAYAAVNGLKGMDESEIPDLWKTFKSGWFYIFSLVALVYMLVWLRLDLYAPYYAAGILIVCSLIFRKGEQRFNLDTLRELIVDSAKIISNIIAILAGVGMIVGSLAFTGVGGAFSRELLQIAGDNLYLLLGMGAVTSFLLGMGMTVSACYIFLAIILGPALIGAGLDPIASHLFILYWGMLSFITPPVALAAVAAAIIAKADPMAIGIRAMRLGLINFILPFIFVLNPALILRGTWDDIIVMVSTAMVAVWLMSAGFEGYLYRIGVIGWSVRIPVLIAAACLLYPEVYSKAAGLMLVIGCYAYGWTQRDKVAT